MEKQENTTNQEKIKELESRLNEKILRAEKLEKSIKMSQREYKETRRHKNGSRFLSKLIIVLLLTIILGFMVTFAYLYFSQKFAEEAFQAKSAMVSRELVQCAELATVKVIYKDIATPKNNNIIGKSYKIIKFTGVARAGIDDISKIQTVISPDLNTISITMPTCTLLSNDISSFELFDEFNHLLAPVETEKIFKEIEKERDKTGETLINEGLINEANNHAKSLLTQVFTAMGFKFVDIKIVDNAENL